MHFSPRTGGAFVADSKWEINTTESPDNDLSHFGRRKPHGGIWSPTLNSNFFLSKSKMVTHVVPQSLTVISST